MRIWFKPRGSPFGVSMPCLVAVLLLPFWAMFWALAIAVQLLALLAIAVGRSVQSRRQHA